MQQQIVVHPMAEHPIQSPFEHRHRVIERETFERRDAVDDELHLRSQPLAQTGDGKHPDVRVREILCVRRFVTLGLLVRFLQSSPPTGNLL